MEYCMVQAEICFSGVLAYAEYNGIGFKVVAATSRDMSRDVARHDARHGNISWNTACFELKFIIRRFWQTLNTIGHVSKS